MSDRLRQAVQPTDVGEFVQHHDAEFVRMPAASFRGQQNRRPRNPPPWA